MLAVDRQRLDELCRRFGVRRLELFGSAARGGFDPETSDYDFFVEFVDGEPGEGSRPPVGAFKRYMGLKFGLEDLLGRPVDLVEIAAVTNPFFLAHVAPHRVEVYRAA
jgi:predicted nucleotidyltransferase